MNTDKKSGWRNTIPFIIGCMIIGFGGSLLGGVNKKQDWYDNNRKPAIWPPQWFFPLVWVANYTLMGIATSKIWQNRQNASAKPALTVFGVHLLHNFVFIPAVYSVKKRWFYVLMDGLGVILGGLTTRAYSRVSRPATFWMLPYLLWLVFTTFIKILWWRSEKAE